MGFFKDFKDDFSQAVNELMPGEDNLDTGSAADDLVVNTLEGEVDVASELSKLDGLLEQVARQEPVKEAAKESAKETAQKPIKETAQKSAKETTQKPAKETTQKSVKEAAPVPAPAEVETTPVPEKEDIVASEATQNMKKSTQEERNMADNTVTPGYPVNPAPQTNAPAQEKVVTDEVSVITAGTIIRGDIISNGSLDVQGQVNGNVSCNGKLTVTGVVNGNSNTSEFFADAAQVEGEVVSTGTVKIGLGSVIIGNVTSTSAVIAGAIKGDIDVQGPVVVDTSAVVMGNIKSRSVQINNGAVIEGFCSQCYSDVDVQSLFDTKKGN